MGVLDFIVFFFLKKKAECYNYDFTVTGDLAKLSALRFIPIEILWGEWEENNNKKNLV